MASANSQRAPRTAPAVRRAQLVDAAVAAFAKHGFEGVELQTIADEVGVTRNLIHHYFPGGKTQLHLEAVRQACEEIVEVLDVDPRVSLDRKMPANVAAYLDEILGPTPRYQLYVRALHSAGDDLRSTAVAAREQIAAGVARNHLGVSKPAKPIRAALVGFIAFAETTAAEWRDLGLRDRPSLEQLLTDVLVATVAAAQRG